MKFFIYIAASVTLAAVFNLAGCAGKAEDAAKKGGPVPGAAPAVVAATIEQKTVPIMGEFIGRTAGHENVDLRARVEGFLVEAPFQEGSVVRKGQVLFRIDPRTYEAKRQTANAQLAKAKSELQQAKDIVRVETSNAQLSQATSMLDKSKNDVNRLEPLAKEQAIPQQDLDDAKARLDVAQSEVSVRQSNLKDVKLNQTISIQQAEAAVESAQSAVTQAQLDLDYCKVVSPIDGIIGTKKVDVGNLVGRGEATLLATVSTVNPFKVTFAVAEQDYLQLMRERSKGKGGPPRALELILADNSVFDQKGTVIATERAVDEKTGTFQLQGEFANPNNLVRPGQFARIRVPIGIQDNAVLLPQRAVSELQSAKVVYVIGADNTVQLRSVQLGPRYGEYYVALSGLKAGERIVVDGIQKVRPGMTVSPTEKPVSSESKR
jgi:membrane fusion protein (multidrug efflux system)